MKTAGNHPEDLLSYVDGDPSDRRYEQIRLHIDSCAECREEIRLWRSMQEMLRAPEFEIEVPPLQWPQIQGRIGSHPHGLRWREKLAFLWSTRWPAWSTAFVLILLIAVTVSGFNYRKQVEADHMFAIAVYSESEWLRIRAADNPFRNLAADSAENPFARFQVTDKGNPFAIR